MPIYNIIDKRTNNKNARVMAVLEDSHHDYTIKECNNLDITAADAIMYLGIASTTIRDVIGWVTQQYPEDDLTLFLYDVGCDNYADYETIIYVPDNPRTMKYQVVRCANIEDDEVPHSNYDVVAG
jgi:hypothetical protein